MLTDSPIPGPKPWTDELERAAIMGCAYACSPHTSLRSLGIPSSSAYEWLSDNPPEAYKSACAALLGKLNKASSWCERSLLSRIARAGEDPGRWQANAWILERSHSFSQRYVQQGDIGPTGPATIVNIGTVNVIRGERPRIAWRDDGGESVDVEAITADVTISSPPMLASKAK
jgi:hypothetical protein